MNPATLTRIQLVPEQFESAERPLVVYGDLTATTFRFTGGVCAVRLKNSLGELVLLPFQGQQIWSAEFSAQGVARRPLTMRSMFDRPRATHEFLATFGGFLQHCGVSGVGGPSAEDDHALHGELPNAPYEDAWLLTGTDQNGPFIGLGGSYRHTVAFGHNYLAEPCVKLHSGRSLFHVAINITNLKKIDMELFYLAHVNFRPVDGGRLVYSAVCSPRHVRVRTSVPAHINPPDGYREFIDRLARDPSIHETLDSAMAYDPEVVFFIDYLADEEGWAHTLQVHPDGSADYLRHRPAELPRATRWISRTPDQDAIALVEAGTSEPEGYRIEKAKGNFAVLKPSETFKACLDIGMLDPAEANRLEEKVQRLRREAS